MRRFLLFFGLFLPLPLYGASCNTLNATYGVFSNGDLTVEKGVTINGNSVTQDDYAAEGIETDGSIVATSPGFPGIEPSIFPGNSSSTKVDSDDSPISSTTEVFYEEVRVKKNDAMSFTGDGPFHIKDFKVEEGATLTLDSGVFYVETFDIRKNGSLIINSGVQIHISDEFRIEQGFDANAGGDPSDLVVYLHSGATFNVKKNATFSGVVYGENNGDVRLDQGVEFSGSIVSDGKVEIKKNVVLTLSPTQQTAIETVSTCSSGGGGSSSCDVIPISFPTHSAAELKVDADVTINGNSVTEDDFGTDTGLGLDGSTTTTAVTVPEFDPTSFPTNSATADLDEDDSPLDGSSEVFYDKIDVGAGETFTFTGAGPFHIDELTIESGGAINMSAGTYYIRKMEAKDDSFVTVEYPVRIHTNDEIRIEKRAELNKNGEPHDAIIFVYENAKFETDDDAIVVATILGRSNEKVKLDKRTQFTGLILSEGKVELKDDAVLNLTSSQLTRIGLESTCAGATVSTVSHFLIGHDGAGINCLGETFTVSAIGNDGNVVTTFAEEVTIDTQTTDGSYSLTSGNGTFFDATSNDGLMTYTFDTADLGVASFTLSYEQGANNFDLDTFLSADTAIRDDDSEGNLVFAPSGFTVTQTALSNPPPATIDDPIVDQIAGTAFDMHIAAYGQTPTDPTCGIIEDYTGSQNLSFWLDYANPATGTLVPTVDGSSIANSEGSATPQAVTFSSGQASVQVRYKDVGQIQIEMKEVSIRGASTPFVVKPADLIVTLVQDTSATANPGASSMTGTSFVSAGTAFTVEVEVRDSQGSRTPNFGQEAIAEGISLAAGALVSPAGGFNGSANDGAMGNASSFVAVSPAGTFRNTNTSWDETGVIQLQASIADGDYLASGNVVGSLSGNVGRFTVDEFVLASSNVSGSCNNHTYMGEPGLGVSYRLEARASGANVLRNYDTSLAGSGAVAGVSLVAENSDSGVDLSSRLSAPSSTWVNGVRAVASSVEQFSRISSADGPYNDLQVGVLLTDSLDGISLSGLDMNSSTTGVCGAGCNAKALNGTTEATYGRLEVLNSFGPETSTLEVGLRVTSFDAGSFAVNSVDDCTSYQAGGVTLDNYRDGLPTVTVLTPSSATLLSTGVSLPGSGFVLSSPGATNTGSVDLTLDAPAWLEFDWQGSGLEDPMGTAIFGQYRGHDKVIYWREVY